MTHSKIVRMVLVGVGVIIVILVIGGLFGSYGKTYIKNNLDPGSYTDRPKVVILSDGQEIKVRVAQTSLEQMRGLSGTKSLAQNQGMLFVFDKPEQYSFWMKDMLIPIDIVWISADKMVVDITPNLAPETYPAAFSPSAPAQYVLEIGAGEAERLGIMKGSVVSF